MCDIDLNMDELADESLNRNLACNETTVKHQDVTEEGSGQRDTSLRNSSFLSHASDRRTLTATGV